MDCFYLIKSPFSVDINVSVSTSLILIGCLC